MFNAVCLEMKRVPDNWKMVERGKCCAALRPGLRLRLCSALGEAAVVRERCGWRVQVWHGKPKRYLRSAR